MTCRASITGTVALTLLALTSVGVPLRAAQEADATRLLRSSSASTTQEGVGARRHVTLPLSFEMNRGQVNRQAQFVVRSSTYAAFFTRSGVLFSLHSPGPSLPDHPILGQAVVRQLRARFHPSTARQGATTVRLRLLHISRHTATVGIGRLPGDVNYFIGNNPQLWHRNIPTYRSVEYRDVYPGVDLVFYSRNGSLEYDWRLAPGAQLRRIAFRLEGGGSPHVDSRRSLDVSTPFGILRQQAPHAYQIGGQGRRWLGGAYRLTKDGTVHLEIKHDDSTLPLVVDPTLEFATYLGGSSDELSSDVSSIAVDWSGNTYLAGDTRSADFPIASALQRTHPGSGAGSDTGFVAELNARGTALLYSTYLGGSSAGDGVMGIAIDPSGYAYLTGVTSSSDFPTVHSIQQFFGGGCCDAFVAKLAPLGNSLVFSTFLGGSGFDWATGIAIDPAGNSYVVGYTQSTDFPTVGAFQTHYAGGPWDVFVAKLSSSGARLLFSTYLGGSGDDEAGGIAVNPSGNVYVAGETTSQDFPTLNPLQGSLSQGTCSDNSGGSRPCFDAFVVKLAPTGARLEYGTYLGGTEDEYSTGVALDNSGDAYVTGATYSSNFPVTSGSFQTQFHGSQDAFIVKLSPGGDSLLWSTFFGGSGFQGADTVKLDSRGDPYISGYTGSTDFPLVSPVQGLYGGGPDDAFVAKFDSAGHSLVFSTYYGGSGSEEGTSMAVDALGNAYILGRTTSTDLPTVRPLQSRFAGGFSDLIVAKISDIPSSAPPALPTATLPPPATSTPAPMPTDTEIPLDFSVVAVRAEPPGSHGGSVPETPALKQVRAGQTILLSVYVEYDSLPDFSDIEVDWAVKRDGKTVFQRSQEDSKNSDETGTYWYHERFTPTHSGVFHFTGTATIQDQEDDASTTFTVAAPPTPTPTSVPTTVPAPRPSFSFDSLRILDGQLKPRARFHRGEKLYASGGYSLRNVSADGLTMTITQRYAYCCGSNGRWIAGLHPTTHTRTVWGVYDTFRFPYTVPSTLDSRINKIRITDRMSGGGITRLRGATVSIVP